MEPKLYLGLLCLLCLSSLSWAQFASSSSSSSSSHDEVDLNVEGKAVNNPGMDATSKACKYDDGPGWTDCDPFELVRFRVLRLVHGGSQCEEIKNITRHCTPHEFPYGTHWPIQEHRKCVSELKRLKAMLADLYKFIETMHEKGKELFDAYMKLKNKLQDLSAQLEKLKVEGQQQQDLLQRIKDEIEEWKTKSRELQVQLDELKAKYHDLQTEDRELTLKNEQLTTDINVIAKENEGIRKQIEQLTRENEELNRRIMEAEHMKEELGDLKEMKHKLADKLDNMQDKLSNVRDDLAETRIRNLARGMSDDEQAYENKDTHVDLSMEMYITHNKTTLYNPTYKPVYYTTEKYYESKEESPQCLISYYGVTNETCWYETDGEESEDAYVDALGHHLVEAHWKYFTIDVKDQYECDKASHLHYEFLLNRCSPKHYLPVLSIYRPKPDSKSLGTHIYPKVDKIGKNKCWITFLGADGHCERHSNEYNLYNTVDEKGEDSKQSCMDRADWWMKFCDTPVIATYVPDEISTNWHNSWIMHDSHGGRMFEDSQDTKNHINPDSLNPDKAKPSLYKSDFKSMAPKSPDYHDSPEYRKSLHLVGKEKEDMLARLRARPGLTGPVKQMSSDVKNHGGVKTSVEPTEATEIDLSGVKVVSKSSQDTVEEVKEVYEKQEEQHEKEEMNFEKYEAQEEYVPEAPAPYVPEPFVPETEAPYQPETKAPYEEKTEAPYVPETEAPYVPETEAPYKPEPEVPYVLETEAPYVPETEAPYVIETGAPNVSDTEAPYVPETEAPYQEPLKYEEPEKVDDPDKYLK